MESHNLAFVDFCAWLRDRDPQARLRPPSRRKMLSPAQRAALDEERERDAVRLEWAAPVKEEA